jgi:GNAT superfamily N-acetyltransferase
VIGECWADMVVAVRVATHADAGGIGRVSAATGQPATDSGADASYVEHLLSHGTVLVAETDGWVSGWGAIVTTPVGVLLTDLFVDPAWQGMGIGRRILAGLWPDVAVLGRFTFSRDTRMRCRCMCVPGCCRVGPYCISPVSRIGPCPGSRCHARTDGRCGRGWSADRWGRPPRRLRYWLRDGGYGVITAAAGTAGAVTGNLHHLTVGDQRDAEPAPAASSARPVP